MYKGILSSEALAICVHLKTGDAGTAYLCFDIVVVLGVRLYALGTYILGGIIVLCFVGKLKKIPGYLINFELIALCNALHMNCPWQRLVSV